MSMALMVILGYLWLIEKKKNKGGIFFVVVGRKLCSGGDKMRNASGHQCKVKMSSSEKIVNEKNV